MKKLKMENKNMKKLKMENKNLKIEETDNKLCCPLCGSEEYDEYEELMYENGIDDPQYGGKLVRVKITDCRDCG